MIEIHCFPPTQNTEKKAHVLLNILKNLKYTKNMMPILKLCVCLIFRCTDFFTVSIRKYFVVIWTLFLAQRFKIVRQKSTYYLFSFRLIGKMNILKYDTIDYVIRKNEFSTHRSVKTLQFPAY